MGEIRTCSRRSALWLGIFLSLPVTRALAENRADPVEASRHFDRGYLMAQQGNLEAAISEFEQAYALSPHPSVLYNLGQAYAASGRAAQAVHTLRKYLEQSGPKLDAEHRAQVAAFVEYQNQRVGALAIEAEPAGAELMLDGVSLGKAPLPGPVAVTAGTHALTITAPGHVPHSLSIEIAPKTTLHQQVKLERNAAIALLTVTCSVLDVTVFGDRVRLGILERGGTLPLTTRPAELRFERRGFVPKQLPVPSIPFPAADCGLGAVDPQAELVPVVIEAPTALEVRVNGRAFRRGRLPVGRHVLSVSGQGMRTTEQVVQVARGASQSIPIDVQELDRSLLIERTERRRWHRVSALVSAGTGLVGVGVAGVLYAVNQRAYDEWHADGTKLAQRSTSMPGTVSAGDWNRLVERENALRNRDLVALGSALLGGTLLAAGAALWLTAPSSPDNGITLQIGKGPWVGYAGSF